MAHTCRLCYITFDTPHGANPNLLKDCPYCGEKNSLTSYIADDH